MGDYLSSWSTVHQSDQLLAEDDSSLYDDNDELLEHEKEFYTYVRTHVIYFITIIILYSLSYALISRFSRNYEDFKFEEYRPYRISTWICAFTLAISIAAFLLLPVSIITSEASWISDIDTKRSLLDGMWKYVFLFSNLSLFFLLPFAYFLPESEGFSGSRRGMSSRLRETFVLLLIVTIIVLGVTYTVSCLFFGIRCIPQSNNYLQQLSIIWHYLPFLYSCISFMGALLLLLCTPLGISHLFSVLSQMDTMQQTRKLYVTLFTTLVALAGFSIIIVMFNTFRIISGYRLLPDFLSSSQEIKTSLTTTSDLELSQDSEKLNSLNYYENEEDYTDINNPKPLLSSSSLESTSESGGKPIKAFIDIVMILYLWCASLCGLYNLPGLCCLRPRTNNSSFNQIIGNCTILCLLSSALPLLAWTLGMTNFDLLADFGRIEWLGNYYVVLLYNVVFFVSTTLCLMGRRELVLTISILRAIIGDKHNRRIRIRTLNKELRWSIKNNGAKKQPSNTIKNHSKQVNKFDSDDEDNDIYNDTDDNYDGDTSESGNVSLASSYQDTLADNLNHLDVNQKEKSD